MTQSTGTTGSATTKRKYERVSTRRPADLIISDQTLVVTLINLSMEGVGLMVNEALELKQRVQVKFCLPNYDQSSELNLTGLVTHVTHIGTQYLIGLQFAELTQHESLVIKGFINFHHRLD